MQEYECEFSRIVSCLPIVVRSEWDKARSFEGGLRPGIYSKVQLLNISTYRQIVDIARLVERGDLVMRRESEAFEKGKGKEKKRHQGGSGGQSHYQRLPKQPRQPHYPRESQQPAPERCVISGGPHLPFQCKEREESCFKCGRLGHVVQECYCHAPGSKLRPGLANRSAAYANPRIGEASNLQEKVLQLTDIRAINKNLL